MTALRVRNGLAALLLTVLALAVVPGAARAHAYLTTSEPAARSVASPDLERVELAFTEPLETRFSDLRVYRLELPDGALPQNLRSVSEREFMRVNALAAAFATRARTADAGEPPDATRVDHGLLGAERTAASIALALRDPDAAGAAPEPDAGALEPGVYVVVWEVLSIDTHWTTGHLVFFVSP